MTLVENLVSLRSVFLILRMIYLYRMLVVVIFFILFIKNFIKIVRRKGYFLHWKHYFGFYQQIPKKLKKRLWIQAVSVGELNSISTLIKNLSNEFEIFLTTTTSTGYKIIEENFKQYCVGFGFFSLDFNFVKKISLNRIQPDAIILTESELWPEHMYQANLRKISVFLINARLSNNSYKKYRLFPVVAKFIFSKLNFIIASSLDAQKKFQQLTNIPVEYFGNLKFDKGLERLSYQQCLKLKNEFGFDTNSIIIVGCSTWPHEEEMLLNLVINLNNKYKNLDIRLLIIPRHAERAKDIIDLLNRKNIKYIQRSRVINRNVVEKDAAVGPKYRTKSESTENHNSSSCDVDVYLADTTGELSQLIQVGDVCVVGKSFGDNYGGQSPLDAAAVGIPIFYGNHMENFHDICESLEKCNLAKRVSKQQELEVEIASLINNRDQYVCWRGELLDWYRSNQGATNATVEFIKQKLSGEN